ncbi:MAG: hypothetical protein V3W20_09505, partial [Candidatus Neomarinimicrobiota bacterium]
KLYFDVRDIFRSPRLALSGKKIWLFLKANLFGFAVYWIFSYIAIILGGTNFSDAVHTSGLYPCIYSVENASSLSQIIYWIGITSWVILIFFACTAVSRITYKQLKGDDFYSVADANKFVKDHRYPIIFGWITVLIITAFFSFGAVIFALLGKIPFIGEILFALLYILYFFGSVFTIYTLIVFITSFIYSPAIVATLEEDTMGTVFQSYSITWSQPWRLVLYHLILLPIAVVGVAIFKWFWLAGYQLINIIFGAELLMSSKLHNIVGWATDLVNPQFGFCNFLDRYLSFGDKVNQHTLLSLQDGFVLSSTEYIAGTIIAIILFILFMSIVSYGLSILSVGETIIFIIFKKKSDGGNLLYRSDEDDISDDESDQNIDDDREKEKEKSTE